VRPLLSIGDARPIALALLTLGRSHGYTLRLPEPPKLPDAEAMKLDLTDKILMPEKHRGKHSGRHGGAFGGRRKS